MSRPRTRDHEIPFIDKMRREGLPEVVINSFLQHFRGFVGGVGANLPSREIAAPSDLPDADEFAGCTGLGASSLGRVVTIKLNGGLGTSMGLEDAKSLLPVREGLSFLDLIARQATGALRDAESLLDQLLSSRTDTITLTYAQAMLGTASNEAVKQLVSAWIHGDSATGLSVIQHSVEAGTDPQ